jgi:aerobic-type carbon monoxide dehydrogenase small subunit (CoxS/CutS family)
MELKINGKNQALDVPAHTPLLQALRENLLLTGTKYGCGEGACGACMVLVDGTPTPSCITPVSNVRNREVITIEGISGNGVLHRVQKAFLAEEALQCGYCTPGMIISAVALLNKNPEPTESQIKEAMQRNVCRCCVYPYIVKAIQTASKMN